MHLVPAPAVRLMKRRVQSRPGARQENRFVSRLRLDLGPWTQVFSLRVLPRVRERSDNKMILCQSITGWTLGLGAGLWPPTIDWQRIHFVLLVARARAMSRRDTNNGLQPGLQALLGSLRRDGERSEGQERKCGSQRRPINPQ